MKKLVPLVALIALVSITLMSCLHHDRDVSITYHDADRYYLMKAEYSKHKTRSVDQYLDEMLGNETNMSFVNNRINGKLGFNDNTTIYIKKHPGYIKIKLDKYRNSKDAYERIREVCEGMKDVIIDKEVVVRVE